MKKQANRGAAHDLRVTRSFVAGVPRRGFIFQRSAISGE
jgi:hypothetical protein